MKLTGLFKKGTNKPDVTESDKKEAIQKLWRCTHRDVFTADAAREVANNINNHKYLDTHVIRPILESVQNAACRHHNSVVGSLGTTLSNEEIDYCQSFLDYAGYSNISITNVPASDPKMIKYTLAW